MLNLSDRGSEWSGHTLFLQEADSSDPGACLTDDV